MARWQEKFVSPLSKSPNISAACRAARVSRATVYRCRDEHPAFAAAWEDALASGVDKLEATAFTLANGGDSRLLEFLLKSHRRNVYGDTQRHEVAMLGGVIFLPQKAEGAE